MVGCVDAMSDQADGIYGMVMSHSQFLPTVLNPEATELKGCFPVAAFSRFCQLPIDRPVDLSFTVSCLKARFWTC